MSRHSRFVLHVIVVCVLLSLCVVAAERPTVVQAAGEFWVTTTADMDGVTCGDPCSLRQAINAANAAGDAVVRFRIPSSDAGFQSNGFIRTWRITLSSALGGLPALEAGTDIDGVSQQSANIGVFNPLGPDIIVDGRTLLNRSGITINSPDAVSEVRGLAIVNFNGSGGFGQGVGINVVAGSGHIIQGNFVGVDQQNIPTQAGGNGFAGIWVQGGASAVTIGGQITNQEQSNIISNNNLDGIVLQGSNNIVRGNYIGTDYGAFIDLPNQGAGVLVYSSTGNVIGPGAGQDATYGNFISGNRDYGIVLDGGRSTEIAGNYIGIGVDGVVGSPTNGQAVRSAPNGAGGIELNSDTRPATGNQIGVPSRPRNFISGNQGPGIRLRSLKTSATIVNNVIGLDGQGQPMGAPNNIGGGVVVSGGATDVTIGGPTFDDNNVISANGGAGIFISAPSLSSLSVNNRILNNCIGTGTACQFNRTVPSPFANAGSGIVIGNHVRQTTIGGAGDSLNIIGYNLGYGIAITGTGVLTTTIAGNAIRFNSLDGIFVSGAGNTQIGGAAEDDPIIVSDNLQNGIRLANASTNSIQFGTLNTNGANGLFVSGGSLTEVQFLTLSSNGQNGIRFTDSTTMTVTFNQVRQNQQHGILVSGAGMRDVAIGANTVLTNTLSGIYGSGSSTNTNITGNLVRGHNGSGIRWDGPATDTLISNNTVYSNTLLGAGVTAPQHAIWLASAGGTNATITGNFVRGNANGAGIVLGPLNNASISANTEVNRNGLEGIRVDGPALNTLITGNTVISNTLVGTGAGGIVISSTTQLTMSTNTVRGHTNRPGILLTAANNALLEGNSATKNQVGLAISGGISTTVRAGLFNQNSQHGVLATATSQLTLTQQTEMNLNGGSGARILGASSQVNIVDTRVYSNTVNGVQLGDGGGGPHPQRVKILDTRFTGNGYVNSSGQPTVELPVAPAFYGLGIVFSPQGPPESASNPNHDIDPPTNIAISPEGVVTGRVDTGGGPQSCLPAATCRVQVFRASPASRDGQGRDRIGDTTVSASGMFTVSVGAIPAQLALTATDQNGNTSPFGLFTATPGLEIGPDRTASARPGDVVTYTHRVTNTGNIHFTSLLLSATSSRGWDQITITPSGAFSVRPGESQLITVSVKLPTGADPRVAASGGPDTLTVTVTGRYRLEGQTADQVVSDTALDVTNVEAKVVIELVPPALSGRGLPGTTLPYVHTIRNSGNIASTIALTVSTNLNPPGVSPPPWVTTLSPSGNITLQPGEQRSVSVLVTIPPRSTNVTSGTVALTTLRVTTVDPVDATQNRVFTDTTTVTFDAQARMLANTTADGAADEVTPILHTVENLSNGPATFRLLYNSSLGSTVTFQSQSGTPLTGPQQNTFSMPRLDEGGGPARFNFVANIRVNRQALPGQTDTVYIYLVDTQGNIVGGAFVIDTIRVTRGAMAPRLYLPVVAK
ncbi:MAG TPA: right-handed parallel beta-helix repeat-containing protein [Roseiflexaceae bacterium]|nr:right-handed parallel beta-helix repeat-containing protein [Roseiflexaceae bacterium]